MGTDNLNTQKIVHACKWTISSREPHNPPYTYDDYYGVTETAFVDISTSCTRFTSTLDMTGALTGIPLRVYKNGVEIASRVAEQGTQIEAFNHNFVVGDLVKFEYDLGNHPATYTYQWDELDIRLDGSPYGTDPRQAWCAVLINGTVVSFGYWWNNGDDSTYTMTIGQPIAHGDSVMISFGLSDSPRVDFYWQRTKYTAFGDGVASITIGTGTGASVTKVINTLTFDDTLEITSNAYPQNGYGGGTNSRQNTRTMSIVKSVPVWEINELNGTLDFYDHHSDVVVYWT